MVRLVAFHARYPCFPAADFSTVPSDSCWMLLCKSLLEDDGGPRLPLTGAWAFPLGPASRGGSYVGYGFSLGYDGDGSFRHKGLETFPAVACYKGHAGCGL